MCITNSLKRNPDINHKNLLESMSSTLYLSETPAPPARENKNYYLTKRMRKNEILAEELFVTRGDQFYIGVVVDR